MHRRNIVANRTMIFSKSKVVVLGLFLLLGQFGFAQYVPRELPALLKTIDHKVFQDGDYQTTRVFRDKHNGVSHAYGYQTFGGIEIEGAKFGAHTKAGQIVHFTQSFVATDDQKQAGSFSQTPNDILKRFIKEHQPHFSDLTIPNEFEWKSGKINEFVVDKTYLSDEAIKIKKTYLVQDGSLVPSWSLSFLLPDASHWYYSIFSAVDGTLLEQYDWNLSCSAGHLHAPTPNGKKLANPVPGTLSRKKKGDGSSYKVFALPLESPSHGPQTQVKDPSNALASPYGWHDVDGLDGHEYETTRGNNVWATEDRFAINSPGYSPDGGSKLNFNFSYSNNADPADNMDAAITNLFYWNNTIHDIIYHYGFDEISGNFQENNYGKSGFGEYDPVMADAMDGSGTNNANFATPPDGSSPRMQMFLWETPRLMGAEVLKPSSNAGTYYGFQASFGPALTKKPITGSLVLAEDATSNPTLACSPLVNGSSMKGKIALIERGTCTFATKIRNAQNEGAIAVLMFTDERSPVVMGGDGTESDISIPSMLIDRASGLLLMNELKSTTISVKLYDSSEVKEPKDSDFDNGIIAHEYGHGISIRLTGGADDVSCLYNQEQMGEGWSDFFALAFTHRLGDKATDKRGIGTFVRGESTAGGGIRPYPYSTDTSVSLYTYNDIASLSVPHGVGAVWCSMLWDLYWALIDEYGYDSDLIDGTGGNNICIQLVMDGLKLQPCGPGFVDGRDAIIAADKLNNGGKNEKLIWEAFAKRGLGYGADQGDSDNLFDGTTKYDIPPKFRKPLVVTKTAPDQIQEDGVLAYSISVKNQSKESLFNIKLTDTIPAALSYDESSSNCDWSMNGQVLTMTIDELETGAEVICTYQTTPRTGDYSKVLLEDGAEQPGGRWSTVSEEGTNEWYRYTRLKTEGEHSWFVEDNNESSDQSLVFDLGVVGKDAVLSFENYVNMNTGEEGHGGVVEFSDNGTDWFDAKDDFLINGYNDEIGSISGHPLANRSTFSGFSGGFKTTQIDLSSYEGKSVKVRFRFVSDVSTFFFEGWCIDDLKLLKQVSVTNKVWASVGAVVEQSSAETTIYEKGEGDEIEENILTNTITIYPNPVSDFVMVQASETINNAMLTVTDINGSELYRERFSGTQARVNTKVLASGCYILSVSVNDTIERHRFIKE